MILLLIPAIIAVLIIATLFSLQFSSVPQKDAAYNDTLNSARAYAHDFNTDMSDYLVKSETFALVLDQNISITREEVLDIQHAMLRENPKAIGIGVIFEPGTFDGPDARYANTPGFDATGRFGTYWNRLNGTESLIPVVDIETSDWYTIPKQTRKEIVMEPLLYEGELMTSYITPIIRNGTFTGTVGIDVPLKSIDQTVSQVKVFDTGYAFLVSNSGIFVSSPKKEYLGRMSLGELSREKNIPGLAAMAADIHEGKEGYAEMADPFTGKNVVMFYSPIQTSNWSMVVVAPTDEMLAGVANLGRIMLLIGLLSIVFVGGIILIVARNLSGPIVAMSRTADRIASGDLDVFVSEQDGELGILANAFNNMATRLRELIGRLEAKVVELQDTQAAFQESEEKYRHLIENSHDIIYTLNTEGILTFVSPSWTTHLGQSVTEVVGKSFQQFVHPDDLSRCMEYLQIMIKTGQRQTGVEYRILHADGSWRWHITNAVPLRNTDGMIVGGEGSASDITDRKQADEALLKNAEELHAAYEELTASQEELRANLVELTRQEQALRTISAYNRSLLEASLDPMVTINHEGKIADVNLSTEKVTGHSREELIGTDFSDYFTEPAKAKEVYQQVFTEGTVRDYPLSIRHRDGHITPVLYNATVYHDEAGNVSGVFAAARDMTERRRAEDGLMRVNQKLNILSQLTRKDLTNQTFVLSSYLELTKNQLTGQDSIIETLQKSEQAIQSINKTIEYSKDYQDMGAKPPKWLNVNTVMLFGLSHISIGNIQHSLETEDLEIFADPLLEKVCQRLFENSVKHGDHVTVIRVWHTVTPDRARIVFEDDGIGIPQEMKEQIFLRSEGTSASRGSLIFVREILDITGISIRETGEPGKGARFEMTVPKGAWRMAGKRD